MCDSHVTVRPLTPPPTQRSHFGVVGVPAEVGREVQALLPGVARPALLVPAVRQVPAAQPQLELPETMKKLHVPSRDTEAHGWRGNMKAALVICCRTSSSSLKGKVPLRLTYTMTPTDHMSRERL
ncbi:hypothetical protein EYF80_064450 [Liparis tanakae]|uniref:Uncharacterized protein n=1 Tax=Liparis tanakae TaxID=230148 RepID=A0A4Z2E9J1_9TELE|nr:hypothetical protein EYF80_064450 [Liparis tanakae]